MSNEVNFDGLVGPTHNHAGLSLGNRASIGHAGQRSSPRRAALQGLAKMRHLVALGVPQGVLPPQRRPDPAVLRRLGFDASTTPDDLGAVSPGLLAMVMSASSMWTANAATVSPSPDTRDGRVHLTPANLSSMAHRSFEAAQTHRVLLAIFADTERFRVHPPLPPASAFSDEGAANHGRYAEGHGEPAVHVFVYGRDPEEPNLSPAGFPRRQSRLAGELISRSHGHDPTRVVHLRQSAEAIDAGAFHNDVVAVINERVVFAHENAYADPAELHDQLTDATFVVVPAAEVPLSDAISSYLFNSQLVTLPDGSMTLIAPAEVADTPSTSAWVTRAIADRHNPIGSVHSFDLRESMSNGGGPACLRLRVVLSDDELAALKGNTIVDNALLGELERWVNAHYRDELTADDLADPDLWHESSAALDELTEILDLPGLYADEV
jgi:succinylarginine dihydrolase